MDLRVLLFVVICILWFQMNLYLLYVQACSVLASVILFQCNIRYVQEGRRCRRDLGVLLFVLICIPQFKMNLYLLYVQGGSEVCQMGYLIFYSGYDQFLCFLRGCLSSFGGLLDPGTWVWGVCCAGISPVGLVSESLLSAVSFLDQVGCVLSAGFLGLVDLNYFLKGISCLGGVQCLFFQPL